MPPIRAMGVDGGCILFFVNDKIQKSDNVYCTLEVTWLKVELCTMLEDKRFATLRCVRFSQH
ncbi:hypothetical protein CsSME_00039223 [Camellia sinensis var. sinensis]